MLAGNFLLYALLGSPLATAWLVCSCLLGNANKKTKMSNENICTMKICAKFGAFITKCTTGSNTGTCQPHRKYKLNE